MDLFIYLIYLLLTSFNTFMKMVAIVANSAIVDSHNCHPISKI
jgi:hypothetical protein